MHIMSCPASSVANCKTCTYNVDNFLLSYVHRKWCAIQVGNEDRKAHMDINVSILSCRQPISEYQDAIMNKY